MARKPVKINVISELVSVIATLGCWEMAATSRFPLLLLCVQEFVRMTDCLASTGQSF